MSRASRNGNGVGQAVEQACGLYGVEIVRMQSRVFTVTGVGGRTRPMFVGQWRDQLGVEHTKGMADYLARPQVLVARLTWSCLCACHDRTRVTVPLWIETKFGTGTVRDEQMAFRRYVESNGESWLEVHNDAQPLLDWFKQHGVERRIR